MTVCYLKVLSKLRGNSCDLYLLGLFKKSQYFNFDNVKRTVISSSHNSLSRSILRPRLEHY